MAETLNIPWLRLFIAAPEGGAPRAAGVTQPTVWIHIGNLEKAIGQTLFERHRRLRLSEAGENLLPKARRVIELHGGLFLESLPVGDSCETQRKSAVRLLKQALGELGGGRDAAGDRP